jgi:hypothetical protein
LQRSESVGYTSSEGGEGAREEFKKAYKAEFKREAWHKPAIAGEISAVILVNIQHHPHEELRYVKAGVITALPTFW